MDNSRITSDLVGHLFRNHWGQGVAILTRQFGIRNLEAVEDALQESLLAALRTWPTRGTPDNPSAWLYTVARNRLIDKLRSRKRAEDAIGIEPHDGTEPRSTDTCFRDEIVDDVLSLIFLCNDPALSPDSRCCLTLHVVCGFGTREIAAAYFTREDTIARRLTRAKQKLMSGEGRRQEALFSLLSERLTPVLEVVYLLFNAGYSANGDDTPNRFELCSEALRLARLIAAHPRVSTPEACALLALICFQSARLPSRTDEQHGITLLQEQNRALWDKALISEGSANLARSATGTQVTRYHLEAGIACCHVSADSYDSTNWTQILYLYDQLLEIAPDEIVRLNRLVALAMVRGVEIALVEAKEGQSFARIKDYYLYHATLADLYRRNGDEKAAAAHFRLACERAPGERERRFFLRRLSEYQSL